MKLTPEDMARLLAEMDQKWPVGKCSQCQAADWKIPPIVFELREFTGRLFSPSPAVFPVIAAYCGNCGNTLLVNPSLAGFDLKAALESNVE